MFISNLQNYPRALFLAYHTPFNYSSGTAALVRRIEHYARALIDLGFSIDIIAFHSSADQSSALQNELFENIFLLPIPNYRQNKVIRKVETLLQIFFYGDLTGKHFANFKAFLPYFKFQYSHVFSFFTPRGPIQLGHVFKKKHPDINWIIDLQDTYDEGIPDKLRLLNILWTKNKIKSANAIVQVSPEWAFRDSKILNKPIYSFRHVIPERVFVTDKKSFEKKTLILYAGNIHFQEMDPSLLFKSLRKKPEESFSFSYAGNKNVYDTLSKQYTGLKLNYQGFLKKEELNIVYRKASIIVIFTWEKANRQVIPSKFYEACSFEIPILITGKDSGAFKMLFKDWGHPNVLCDTEEKVSMAIEGLQKGSTELLFTLDKCSKPVSSYNNFKYFLANLL